MSRGSKWSARPQDLSQFDVHYVQYRVVAETPGLDALRPSQRQKSTATANPSLETQLFFDNPPVLYAHPCPPSSFSARHLSLVRRGIIACSLIAALHLSIGIQVRLACPYQGQGNGRLRSPKGERPLTMAQSAGEAREAKGAPGLRKDAPRPPPPFPPSPCAPSSFSGASMNPRVLLPPPSLRR